MEVENLTLTFYGLTFTEVNLFISDIVMGFTAFYCFKSLKQVKSQTHDFTSYRLFFAFTALAAITAGLGHLLQLYTYQYLKLLGFVFSIIANYYMIVACIQYIVNETKKSQLKYIAITKIIIVLILLVITQSFSIISIDSILSIAVIALPIHYYQWKKYRNNAFAYFCFGILFTMLTGIITYYKITISSIWFNSKDFNHIIVSGGLLMLYSGVKKL